MAHFVALPKLSSAKETVEAVLFYVFQLHGLPQDIVSDPQFASQFWKEFYRLPRYFVLLPSVLLSFWSSNLKTVNVF